jgi:hypothetical protein
LFQTENTTEQAKSNKITSTVVNINASTIQHILTGTIHK